MQTIPPGGTYQFTCPACDEQVTVDAGMQELLLLDGCVVCDTRVTAMDFEPLA